MKQRSNSPRSIHIYVKKSLGIRNVFIPGSMVRPLHGRVLSHHPFGVHPMTIQDNLKELDTLFDVVKSRVKHLIVLLTANTLRRPWCVGEIVTGLILSASCLVILHRCDLSESRCVITIRSATDCKLKTTLLTK